MRGPRPRRLGCDAAWADDFHHALRTLLTGERDGYYADFGQRRPSWPRPCTGRTSTTAATRAFRRRRFGAPGRGRARRAQFVVFSQNHDQVGNRAFGDRHAARERGRWPPSARCSSPFVPLLFMGEEYGEQAPFQFFSDHIDAGDRGGHARGPPRASSPPSPRSASEVPDPQDPATFERSKLTPPARRGARASSTGELIAAAPARCPAARPRRSSSTRRDRWLRVRRGERRAGLQLRRRRRCGCRATAADDRAVRTDAATRLRRRRDRSNCRRCRER